MWKRSAASAQPEFVKFPCYKLSMRREFSAGGVAIRRLRGEWVFAAIRPGGKKPGVWALPKGLIGAGREARCDGAPRNRRRRRESRPGS